MKKLAAPVAIVASVVGATALVFLLAKPIGAAEKSGGAVVNNVSGRAVPINSIKEFDNVFTTNFNNAMAASSSGQRGKYKYWFEQTVAKDYIQKKIFVLPNARSIPERELEQLRANISSDLKRASASGTSLEEIASGSIGDNFFDGKIVPMRRAKAGGTAKE